MVLSVCQVLRELLVLGFLDLERRSAVGAVCQTLLELLTLGFLDRDRWSAVRWCVLVAAVDGAKILSKCCVKASSKVALKRKDESRFFSGSSRRF